MSGARRRAARPIATSPRASSRRSAARFPAAARGSVASSAALARGEPLAVERRSVRAAHSSVRGRPFGGSTSESARAGVEQYSPAIHSARSTSSRGTESSRTPVGVTSFSGGTSVRSASPTTTPSSAWRPNGTRTIEPTSTGSPGSA